MTILVDDLTRDQSPAYYSTEHPAIERRIGPIALQVVRADLLLPVWVEDTDIRWCADAKLPNVDP